QELNTLHTNPLRDDSDSDGLLDGAEVNTHHTNPLSTDSDNDGFPDGAEIAQQTDPSNPGSHPDNIAPRGTGILGTKESLETGDDLPVFNAGAGTAINDFDFTTRVDTYNGGAVGTVSFVGVVWDQPVTNPISKLELTLATFFDGGWFGVNGIGPGSGNVLSASEHLQEPIVQVSHDKGATWENVPFTSDYIQALTGHPLPAVDFGAPTAAKTTFTLTTPQTGINGIRIVGTEGGTASGGFLGVFELAVRTSGSSTDTGEGASLGNIAKGATGFQFQFDSSQGKTHLAQYKDTLTDATWQTLSTIPGDGSRKTVTDTAATRGRFYRVSTQ
ncbi:MAG TPA: thrombospondin type 3 repeat-containing protein, partial [Verrucomicrobiae bacterium]|nr:thrombospondin type 3 repeat-containing protein [Verrucomicrobiae bacterium]